MTEEGRREAAAEELRLAREELIIADQLLRAGHHRVAISRAYFAVFHAARGRLYAEGIEPKSHAGVQSMWSSHLVKSGHYPPATARVLARLQRYRELADYSLEFVVDEAGAHEDVQAARDLVEQISGDLD